MISIAPEIRERERTGLDTPKVGYNAVHGYYIRLGPWSKPSGAHQLCASPDENAERYIIPELKEYEDKALTRKAKRWRWKKHSYMTNCLICCCRIWPIYSRAPTRWRGTGCAG
ncbi:hypothetical protein KCP77_07110 [Salmonella enterica subsp. enterica]|nr:hypothetical protein KCP77_07110 [Salmonella enterica subsp. enterica]